MINRRRLTTNEELNLPVYLHFLNRELARSVEQELTLEQYGHYILLAMIATDTTLLSSIAFVWESGILGSELGSVVADLITADHLMLVSEFATLNEFVSSSQALYRHDRSRYPMYFDEPGQKYMSARPGMLKNTSTTSELERSLQSVVSGGVSILYGLPDNDAKRVINSSRMIDQTLIARDGRALTLSLFESGQEERSEVLPIGRLLSTFHLRHYLDLTGSDILTGIRQLRYFDSLSRGYPRLEVRVLEPVLKYVGLGPEIRMSFASVLAMHRASPQHRLFLDLLAAVLGGLASAVDPGVLNIGTPEYELQMKEVRRIFDEQTDFSRMSLSRDAPYDLAIDRLAHLNLTLEKQIPAFKAYRERRQTMTTGIPRALILVATEVERDAFINKFSPTELHRSFAVQHTLFHLGVVGGVEVLLAQSEQGTEAPAAMTLTAIDLIDHASPRYLVLAGICFGLKESRQSLGDVLVSTQLRMFDPKKIIDRSETEHAIPRGDKVSPSVLLLDRFRSASADWRGSRVHFGPILSANTLVNSGILRRRLTEAEPDAIGGEMEGAGAYAAGAKRKVDWIVAKAVSDWGYGKTDDVQRAAADNVASYIFHVLAIGGLGVGQSY
jgi:nucleoside phosphorylase